MSVCAQTGERRATDRDKEWSVHRIDETKELKKNRKKMETVSGQNNKEKLKERGRDRDMARAGGRWREKVKEEFIRSLREKTTLFGPNEMRSVSCRAKVPDTFLRHRLSS